MIVALTRDNYMFIRIVTLITLLAVSASCCCGGRGPEERVLFTSNPSEAHVLIDGYDCGTTPVLVGLNKRYDHSVMIAKEGLEPVEGWLMAKRCPSTPWPLLGAIVGTGVGIACASSGCCFVPDVLLGTVVGATVGSFIGLAEMNASSCCDKSFHAELAEQ